MQTIVLLAVSNAFMTAAWYGHLKFKEAVLWKVILASWLIAFVEYCFQVPANRWGHGNGPGQYSLVQLKTIQEVLNLLIFGSFVVLYFGEGLKWNHLAGFACLVAAVFFVFKG
ncbi:MAG: DMT family protein [Planctomycetes bacterium]|nr:DMT family protein [Planctomycetota bacterium]